jgi:DnaK suppressor protein
VPKPASKAQAKPTAKSAGAKPPIKPVAKPPVRAAAQPAGKPVAKPAAKPAGKPVAKPAAKAGAPVVAKPVVAEPAPQAPTAAPAAPTRKSKSRAALVPAPTPVVPTHSPDAAKASYVSATERLTAPPPAAAVIRKDPKLANNWKTKRPEELSDEEVKSMPDSEYMNDVQLAFFRLKLVKLKQDIHNSAGETTEHLREDTVVVPDPADRATIEEEHALELRTRDRERKLLKKIEQSIARIDAGDYGYCDETGEAIGVARLIARPTASLSLEAQQRRELKQKMFGD